MISVLCELSPKGDRVLLTENKTNRLCSIDYEGLDESTLRDYVADAAIEWSDGEVDISYPPGGIRISFDSSHATWLGVVDMVLSLFD